MAIRPADAYPGQVVTSDPEYPHGKARNVAYDGDPTGTPLHERWLNDVWGWCQALLDAASITPSGDPDRVGASDYLDALKNLFTRAPASSVDGALAIFDGITGRLLKQAAAYMDGAHLVVPGSGSVKAGGEFEFVAAKARTHVYGPGRMRRTGSTGGGLQFSFGVNGSIAILDEAYSEVTIDLDRFGPGMTLTGINVRVLPGAARATTGNRVTVDLFRVLHTDVNPSGLSPLWTGTDDGTASAQYVHATGTAEAYNANYRYYVRVRAGNNANTVQDQVGSTLVSLTQARVA